MHGSFSPILVVVFRRLSVWDSPSPSLCLHRFLPLGLGHKQTITYTYEFGYDVTDVSHPFLHVYTCVSQSRESYCGLSLFFTFRV